MKLRAKLVSLRNSSFARSVIVLAGGTALAQAISVLVLPIITRLYSPADFRIFAVYIASVQLVSVGACLRLEVAIPMPESDEDAANLLVLALASALVISVATALVLWLLPTVVESITREGGLGPFRLLIPLGVFATSLYSALQYWATRKRRFPIIARTRMAQSVTAATIQIGSGLLKLAPLGLLIGNIFQSGAGVTSLARNIRTNDRQSFRRLTVASMRQTWREYIRFPKYSVTEAVSHMGSLQLPIIIIASLPIGPEAGFLSLAMRVMAAPIGLIGAAVAQVFASTASDSFRQDSLPELTAKTFGGLLKSAVGPMIFLGIIAPPLFTLVFGHKWERAGELVRWLTPLFIAQLLASPLGMILYVTGRQRTALAIHVFGLFFRVSTVGLAAATYQGWVSEAYAASGFIFYVLYMAVSLSASRIRSSQLFDEIKGGARHIGVWSVAAIIVQVVLTRVHLAI